MNGIFVRGATRPVSSSVLAPARRGLASHAEEVVTWSEYRSGKVTLQQWVDGNRHIVAGGLLSFYGLLAVYFMRPKKPKQAETEVQNAPSTSSAE